LSIYLYHIQERAIVVERKYKQGRFSPKNPKKYDGDASNIIYRSSYELRLFQHLDRNDNVISWSSEEMYIPYISPIDNRQHRYFPDVIAKLRLPDKTIKTLMIEIKPFTQTQEPKVQSRRTKRYITEVMTWGQNQAKWKAAQDYCIDKGWEFKIMTEAELGIK